MRGGEGSGMCLDKLRAQLQCMQRDTVPIPSETIPSGPIPSETISSETIPSERWGEGEAQWAGPALQRLEARLRAYQRTGGARRAALSASVAEALGEAERLRDAVAQAQRDADERHRALRGIIAKATGGTYAKQRVPIVSQEKISAPANVGGGDGADEELLRGLTKAVEAAQRELEAGDSAARMAEERRCAEERLHALKKRFVEFAQRGIDQIEDLRRERVEAVGMCEQILRRY